MKPEESSGDERDRDRGRATLLERADLALYRARKEGRNRVVADA
jgi:PleD family two-component response regulator